jgi:sugar (pentulose or hexulose) kinase
VTYLALDVSPSSVTAAVWSSAGLVATSTAFAEPTPRAWWTAVETAVVSLDADLIAVEALGVSSPWLPVPVAASGEPVSPDDERVEWVVSARDFVASLLTGRLATDPTMASASGQFSADGVLLGSSPGAPQRGSTEVLGDLLLPAARRLGLRSRIPVVTGATSLVCAVEGAGPAPVVSFGSPVLLAVPVTPPASMPLPDGVALRAGGRSYQVYEAPLHGLTESLDLLIARTGRSRESLASAAAAAAPGTDPVRAAYESVASSVASLLAALAPGAPFVYASGVADRAWRSVLPAATGLPLVHRRVPDVTTCGLAMLVATGVGEHLDRDAANPVLDVDEPFR